MKWYYLFLIFIFFNTIGASQSDSLSTTNNKPKFKILLPAADVVGLNVFVNRFDVWVKNEEWAKVSLSSWKNNLKRGFEPDNDKFANNFFSHPYHGSMFFNGSRSAGNSFWQSAPFVLFGSLMWEYFGETEIPSLIDINTTTLGGVHLGEITNRLSKVLLRNHSDRGGKAFRYLLAAGLNPVGTLNGLFYQSIDKTLKGKQVDSFPIESQFFMGVNQPLRNVNNGIVKTRLHINYSLLYGNIFSTGKKFAPFDAFIFRTWADISFQKDDNPILLNIASQGLLTRKKLSQSSILSLSSHYDFINNQIFKIGNMALTVDYSLLKTYKKWNFVGNVSTGLMLFGSSNSTAISLVNPNEALEYIRNYVFGRGFVIKFSYLADFKKYGRITTGFNQWLNIIRVDATGIEFNTIVQTRYYLPISNHTDIGLEVFQYRRLAAYDNIPELREVNSRYSEVKFLVAQRF